jgi:hypothetical protein
MLSNVQQLHLNTEVREAEYQGCTIGTHRISHGGWPLQPQDIILGYPNLNVFFLPTVFISILKLLIISFITASIRG